MATGDQDEARPMQEVAEWHQWVAGQEDSGEGIWGKCAENFFSHKNNYRKCRKEFKR